ncbi:hypothetical protein DFQ27_007940 [Actinomortierella ambigua]|uniref:F-box domain-containing protein n=1 Tax=Actinomortierella ambigua TaxID=1343610 RepID=A0A9P6TYF8_9FUNG|nr:hypothetical protein DFQ27_007940 [Actinomortierella ambigua]
MTTTIDIDVIALIIDNVDDRGTLFSLLTVSKEVFRYTCRALYRDPFRFIYPYDLSDNARKSSLSLVQLLLALSPAADDDSNLVRRALGVPPKLKFESTIPPTTMVDYLSFIQCVRWDTVADHLIASLENTVLQDWQPPPGSSQDDESFALSTVTWCLCGHQLGRIRELEVEHDAIERYIAAASQLSRLRTLAVAPFYGVQRDDHSIPVVRLVEALQLHHGKDLLRDCHLSWEDVPDSMSKNTFQWKVDIHRLLPLILPRDLKLALPLRPTDSYLSRLESMVTTSTVYHRWHDIIQEYSDMTVGQVLQRCRALTSLGLDFALGRIDDPSVLAWAVDEACERAAGRLRAPAVPLANLKIFLHWFTPSFAHRVLMDGLRGFGPTLQCLSFELLTLNLNELLDGPDYQLPRMSIPKDGSVMMEQLGTIYFKSVDPRLFDPNLLNFCPYLRNLDVSLRYYPNSYVPSWSVVHLPSLAYLKLDGLAVQLFDPASLHGMPNLEEMMLSIHAEEASSPASGERWTDRWTWDWNLPELKSLIVENTSTELTFSLMVLRGCPKLEELIVEFPDYPEIPPHRLDVLSVLTRPEQDVFPNLATLGLSGEHLIQPEDLKILMGSTLPGLKRFNVGTVAPYTTQQLLECTRHHPSLTSVNISNMALDKNEQHELGLVALKDSSKNAKQCIYRFGARDFVLDNYPPLQDE